jgi:3-hydroxyisobutyrate dehydrogenase
VAAAPDVEATREALRVGFIGLGNIGSPMAQHLAASGVDLTIWARRAEALEPFDASVVRAATPAGLARRCDVVCVCVFDADAVEQVIFGNDGLMDGLASGAVVLLHSTVPPDFAIDLAVRCSARGVGLVDAPVSGGAPVAAVGELTIMVGGQADEIDRARPVIDILGANVFLLGGVGAGQRTKLLNNTLLTAQLGLVDSLCALAVELEVDPVVMLEAVAVSSGRSFAVEMYARSGGSTVFGVPGPARNALTKDVAILGQIARRENGVIEVARQFLDSVAVPSGAGHDEVSTSEGRA